MDDRQVVTSPAELIGEAIAAGDAREAERRLGLLLADVERNKDYSINWIASLLSYIGRHLGEAAVEDALRDFGERYLRARRAGPDPGARKRMEAIARAMKANGADVTLDEDDDAYTLSFHCGSGGSLIDGGAYTDERSYLTLHDAGPVTFGRSELPVYCAHCSVNNEIQPIEWDGAPATVQEPPRAPGDHCVHRIYKDQAAIPNEVYGRVGKEKP